MDETNEHYSQDNSGYNTATIMQLRLDCDKLLNELNFFLKGSKTYVDYDEETGEKSIKEVKLAEPKANDEGINSLMMFLKLKINPQVVQGFFPSKKNGESEDYNKYIHQVYMSLIDDMAINYVKWGIEDTNIGLIINTFMQTIIPFMSRLIGDGERGSYAATMKVSENNTIKEDSGFSLFKKRGS